MGDRTTRFRSALTLRLTGEMSGGTAARVIADVEAAMTESAGPEVLVLDMRELELLTADGLRPLLLLAEWGAERGVRCCAVVDPGSGVASVLDTVGARAVLPRFPDVERAMAVVPRAPADDAVDFDVLSEQLEVLTRGLLAARTVGGALQQVVDTTMRVLPAADMVSVSLRSPRGEVLTPVLTHEVAEELDNVQYRAGAGPCVDAADPDGPAFALSSDLATDRRWPDFAALAVRRGYRSVISTGILPGGGAGRVTGALNVYARDDHGLDESDRHPALLLATHAALAVAFARSTELADLHQAELHRAIDSRDVIGQAKGILMQRQGITADEAFELLRTTSQDINVKLVDIARNLVARHRDLDR